MSRPALLNRSVGEYRLIDFLGAGGMGEVYRAVSARTGRVAAVKILLHASPDPSVRERFHNEARLHGQMHHPNIVALYEVQEFEGRPCIVMEYVDGETLADRIARLGPLPVARAVPIFTAVAGAVRYMHEQGIVHRDLKPTNVRIGTNGEVKLLDFGIAKSDWSPGLTQTGGVIGTPHYLSPEQLGSGKATARSDIWALGIMLYEMLSGKVPFEAESITDLWDKVKAGSYARLASMSTAVMPDPAPVRARADRVIARCLKRDPADRYPGVKELVDELSEVGAPRVPTSPGIDRLGLGRTATRFRPYWRFMAGAAAALLLLVLGWIVLGPSGGTSGTAVESAASGPGSVHTINVTPGRAEVYINDVRMGSTPYAYRARPGEGQVRIELRQPGFASWTETVDVTTRDLWTIPMTREDPKEGR
jgi:serine/threonine-protein kinase